MPVWGERHDLAVKRLNSVLLRYNVAAMRTLEQKISDGGPTNQRIDPHILTEARNQLIQSGIIKAIQAGGVPWYYLQTTDFEIVKRRLQELSALHRQVARREFSGLVGQTLEIATFRALQSQKTLNFFGNFSHLDTHDDSRLYRKEEPPSSLNGRQIQGGRELDFLIHHQETGYAGLELKNVREWFYPDRTEIREMLSKCCALDVVPIFIARRIHYSTFSVLNPCGVLFHQTFTQLYPNSGKDLAEQVKDKTLLGYHDVRVGNIPDTRLVRFLHEHLPIILPKARQSYDQFKDLLCAYGNSEISYKSFAARVKRRVRGESEDEMSEIDVLDDSYDEP